MFLFQFSCLILLWWRSHERRLIITASKILREIEANKNLSLSEPGAEQVSYYVVHHTYASYKELYITLCQSSTPGIPSMILMVATEKILQSLCTPSVHLWLWHNDNILCQGCRSSIVWLCGSRGWLSNLRKSNSVMVLLAYHHSQSNFQMLAKKGSVSCINCWVWGLGLNSCDDEGSVFSKLGTLSVEMPPIVLPPFCSKDRPLW